MSAHVQVVGQIARDLVLEIDRLPDPHAGTEVSGRREVLGGKGANQAVAVRQLGETAGLVSVVGDDDVADDVLAQARHDGIDVGGVVRRAGASTGLIVEVLEPDGRWRYLEDLPPPVLLTPEDIAAAGPSLRGADAVLVQLQQPADAVLAAAIEADRGGALVICDGVLPQGDERDRLLDATDVVRADAHEAELLLGGATDDHDALLDAAQELLSMGPSFLALGVPGGNLFVWRDGHLHIPNPTVDVVDTTGAGDAFTAALAVALLQRRPPEGSARHAAAAATVAVGCAGGRPHLTERMLRTARVRVDEVLD